MRRAGVPGTLRQLLLFSTNRFLWPAGIGGLKRCSCRGAMERWL